VSRDDDRFRRTRTHGLVKRDVRSRSERSSRRAVSGSATGAIARPEVRPDRRQPASTSRSQRGRARAASTDTSRSGRGRNAEGRRTSRYGDGPVASLGEARAHRRLRSDADRQHLSSRHGTRPDPRQRARRTVKTTKPLLANRFGAGRPRFRLIATLVTLLVILTAVLAKVGLMQGGGQAEALRNEGAQQWTRTRELPARRGSIFDRNGDELALSVPASTVYVNPLQIEDPEGTVRILTQLVGLDETRSSQLLQKIIDGSQNGVGFLYVARQIEPSIAEQISSLEMLGVGTYSEDRRVMPGGATGLSVIGRTDIDGFGIAGLEAMFGCNPDAKPMADGTPPLQCDSHILIGDDGAMTLEVAPGGRSIAGSERIIDQPVPGVDLITTIDRSVQYAVEQSLLAHVNATRSQGGQVVVQAVNGDIIAMAAVERDSRGRAIVSTANWTAVGAYEPGSVGKVITVAAALNEGVVTPETMQYVPDTYDCTRDPTDLPLSDSHPHEDWSLSTRDILVRSSNVGTIEIGMDLGYGPLYDYMLAFGLGEVSSLGFPGETAGLLKPWQEWEGTERCTVMYGNGLAASPIQLVSAVNTIANDGVYAGPRIVSATVGADGTITPADPTPTRQVVSQEVAEQVQQMMKAVVCDDNGTANQAQVDGLSVAGKTGTSYKVQADGTYFNDEGTRNYYTTFVGFFPAEDPQVTILIGIDDPASGTSGGQSAAPLFRQLVPTIRHEMGIIPPPGSTDCDGE
jgi:cell division protein FtsI (penicillin-binding protein 3)